MARETAAEKQASIVACEKVKIVMEKRHSRPLGQAFLRRTIWNFSCCKVITNLP